MPENKTFKLLISFLEPQEGFFLINAVDEEEARRLANETYANREKFAIHQITEFDTEKYLRSMNSDDEDEPHTIN